MIKKLIIALCLVVIIGWPVSALNFDNITGACYSEYGTGCPNTNLIDGDYSLDHYALSPGSLFTLRFPEKSVVKSCVFYPKNDSTNRNIRVTLGNASSINYTIFQVLARTPKVMEFINTSKNLTPTQFVTISDENIWFAGAEFKCYGYSDSYNDYPVNFTGYPLDGPSPLTVDFKIFNLTNTSGVSWYWGDGQITNTSRSTATHTYDNEGIYTVILNYYDPAGTLYGITKTNYVLVSNPTGLAVNLDIKNAITGALVQDSTVGIKNTTTGVWRNTTAPTGLVYFTSTDPGYLYPLSQNQSITLAANKSGYQDASKTFNIPYNNYREILYMVPTSVVNSTGNGTVVVNVIRALNGLTVSGMSVAMDSGQVGITNTAGAVTLFNVSAGERTVTVTDPSDTYLPTEKVFNLSAGETKLVTVYVARDDDPPVDPDDPFTSPTPTPTGTYDPDDPDSPVYGNYTTSEINQQGGAGVLGMLAQLITLWPAIVIFAFLKFMRSAMT